VQLIPLLKGGQIPGENLRKRVLEICSAEKVRPLTDNVTCIAPTEVSYDIDATYKISTDDAAAVTDIQAAVTKAVDDYITWQRSDLGRDIDPSKLYQLMVDAGAVKVQITKPVLTVLADNQLAVNGTKSVTFGGLADG
jgi:phage-related baseplate assembly protein